MSRRLWTTAGVGQRGVPAFRAMTRHVWLDSPTAIEQHLRQDIPEYDLQEPGVRFILCDDDNQVLMHTHVTSSDMEEDVGDEPDDGLGTGPDATIVRWVNAIGGHGLVGGLLLALTRPGSPALTRSDRECFKAAHHVCAEQSVRLLGVHVVTPRGQRAIRLDDVL